MIRTGHVDARNHGDSPGTRRNVPIASSLFVSCSRIPTLAARNRLAPSICGTVSRLPFGSTVESWLPQAKRLPATCPPLCRALMVQADLCLAYPSELLLGIAGKELFKHFAERRSGIELGENGQASKPDPMDEQIAGWQVEFHCHSAGRMRIAYPNELLTHPVAVELKLRYSGRLDKRAEIVEQILRVNLGGDKTFLTEPFGDLMRVALLRNLENPAHCRWQAVGKTRNQPEVDHT